MTGMAARTGLYVSVLLVVTTGLALSMFLEPGTAEFVVSVLTLCLGLFLGCLSAIVIHLERKRQ